MVTGIDIDENAMQDRRAIHNIVVLTVAQAFNYALAPLAMTIGGLSGSYLLGDDKSLATLPITCFILGPLFGALPGALLMKKIGRRFGFMVGALIGFIGTGLASYAILQETFVLFCFSLLLIGVSISFAQQYRFAAADFGSAAIRTKGLSWVMVGGLFAAVIGPQSSLYFYDAFSPVLFAGSFAGGMILSAVGFIVLLFMKNPPVSSMKQKEDNRPARPLSVIVRQPLFITALLCAALSYMSMSLVMTAAPLAMVICGFSPDQSTTAIQFHIMAMFAPSFFTGSLIVRFGHARIILVAMVLFLVCVAVALSGIELHKFWIALIALGLAWNFGYIGATSLLTKTYETHERSKVQGLFDSLVFGSAAVSSLLSGYMLNAFGWDLIVIIVVPLVVVCAIVLLRQRQYFPEFNR